MFLGPTKPVKPDEWRLTTPSFMFGVGIQPKYNHERRVGCAVVVFFMFYKTRLPLSLSDRPLQFLFSLTKVKRKKHMTFLLKKLQRCQYQRDLLCFSVETDTETNSHLPDLLATIWHGLRDVFIVVVQLCVMSSNRVIFRFFLFCLIMLP